MSALGVAGFRQLRNAGTNVRPDRPSTALVIGGIYCYSRNPLYTSKGFAGIALAVASLRTIAFLVPALVIVRYGVTTREKAYLEREFGDDYRHFRTAVRRSL